MKTLGQRIRELREECDLSLRELGKRTDVTAPFLSDIELGRRYPSDKLLSKMADVLGTTQKDLKNYDNRPPVQDIKRLVDSDPMYGIAFRKVVDSGVTSADLIEFAEKKSKKKR